MIKEKKTRLKNHFTTNAIEGLFGKYKNSTDHRVLPLDQAIDAFVNIYHQRILRSLREIPLGLPAELYQGKLLGVTAAEKLLNEYSILNGLLNDIETGNNETMNNTLNKLGQCSCEKLQFNLPCYHDLYNRKQAGYNPLVSSSDIDSIYFLYRPTQKNWENTKNVTNIIDKKEQNNEYSYTEVMAIFSKMAEKTKRNLEVRNLINETFTKFGNLYQRKEGESLYLPQRGRHMTHPAKLVDHLSRPKNNSYDGKKIKRCSLCHKIGHYKKTCPNRFDHHDNKENDSQNDIINNSQNNIENNSQSDLELISPYDHENQSPKKHENYAQDKQIIIINSDSESDRSENQINPSNEH
ncbi:hypothetical protein TRFO_32054 [Tritrichomonas foetus]|uniref:CCHC-type domain-containing protein n=1 Tax=Tritrichomonas foetus TaxID=1144522 RepID=A0A1J4JQ28_9EUKA|nr:hypothetical protein TRFO_32054 [Tritrichomonas foetus]|eukprot:OHT01217.1 hypothetical protein TRFO_32054 [Tritrichomonas foetus]